MYSKTVILSKRWDFFVSIEWVTVDDVIS